MGRGPGRAESVELLVRLAVLDLLTQRLRISDRSSTVSLIDARRHMDAWSSGKGGAMAYGGRSGFGAGRIFIYLGILALINLLAYLFNWSFWIF